MSLVAAMLEKEGMPADRRAVLAVVAVDALPKGSAVELQIYAEETAQEPVTLDDDVRITSPTKTVHLTLLTGDCVHTSNQGGINSDWVVYLQQIC